MVMTNDPGEVQVPGVGRIGYLREWEDHPGTWDAWLDWPDDPSDTLVCNGGSRSWATYELTRRYQEHLLNSLPNAYGLDSVSKRRDFAGKAAKILACAEWMRTMLEQYFEHVRREGYRIESELKG